MNDFSLFADSTLPYQLNERVQGELRDGELLLWVGQPHPALFARPAIPLVLGGIFFTAFSVFWVATSAALLFAGGGRPGGGGLVGNLMSFFPLFGVPFVLIGLGMLTSPYWMRRRARKTCYALTHRRAVLFLPGWFGGFEVRSYRPESLGKICRTQHDDGSGDLIFEELVSIGTDSDGHPTTSTTQFGFKAIDRVREIEELLTRALLEKFGDGGRRQESSGGS